MSCGSLTPPVSRTLVAQPGLVAYEWYTDWFPCTGLDDFKATLKVAAISGSFRGKVAAQYATVRSDAPDAGAAPTFGTALTANGESCTSVQNVATTTALKFYVRFGVAYDLSAGATAASAEVELQVSYDSCGQIVGASTQQLVATSTTDQFVAVTPWIPALHAAKMKAAVVTRSLTANFQWRMCFRIATASKDSPGAWSTTFHSWQTAGEFNTGELSPTVINEMWVQFGVQYSLSSLTTLGQATVTTAVAVRP